MDLITTPAQQYTVPANSVVLNTRAYLDKREIPSPVHLVQYDRTLPVLAVVLYFNDQRYTLPTGAAVNIRMEKGDGTHVYNPALGVSGDRQTVYVAVTHQMTVIAGDYRPILEIVVDGGVVGTSELALHIARNPVPEDAIESSDEYKTLAEILAEAQEAAQIVEDNIDAINAIPENVQAAQTAQKLAENAYGFANDKAIQAAASATAAAGSASSAADSAAAAAQSAAQAAGSSQLVFFMDPVDGGLNCTINDEEEIV